MKGLIVAAGYGTRFLPLTKTLPKEMLPLYDKPMIDFIIDEFVEAGIRDILIITSRRKKILDDYFDREFELETILLSQGKKDTAKLIAPRDLNIAFIRQKEMKGTGHAILLAKDFIGKDSFVVAYPDDIVLSKPGLTKSLVDLHNKTGKNILSVRREMDNVSRYGVIHPEYRDNLIYMKEIVEKPSPEEAPSNLVSIGRYLFTYELLELLDENYKFHEKGEFYHIDSINALARDDKVLALVIDELKDHLMLDTGEPSSYLYSFLAYSYYHKEGRKILDRFVKEYYNK